MVVRVDMLPRLALILAALLLLHPRFARLAPSRVSRLLLAALVSLAPGVGALKGTTGLLACASLAAGVWLAPAGGPLATAGAFALTGFAETALVRGETRDPGAPVGGDRAATLAARIIGEPLLGTGTTRRLLATNRPVFWGGVCLALFVVAIAIFAPLPVANRRFPEPPRPLAPLLAGALAASLVSPSWSEAASPATFFLPGAWSLLFWGAILLRGLKPRAVVIYYAAAAVVGLYMLVLHAAARLVATGG